MIYFCVVPFRREIIECYVSYIVGVSFKLSVVEWECMWSYSISESFKMCVDCIWVFGSCGVLIGLWCPSILGGVVDGSHGDGGLRRNIPDSGCGRWCFRIGDRVSCVDWVVGVLVRICVWSYIHGVSSKMSVSVHSMWVIMLYSSC